jgi:hypothetical protein
VSVVVMQCLMIVEFVKGIMSVMVVLTQMHATMIQRQLLMMILVNILKMMVALDVKV